MTAGQHKVLDGPAFLGSAWSRRAQPQRTRKFPSCLQRGQHGRTWSPPALCSGEAVRATPTSTPRTSTLQCAAPSALPRRRVRPAPGGKKTGELVVHRDGRRIRRGRARRGRGRGRGRRYESGSQRKPPSRALAARFAPLTGRPAARIARRCCATQPASFWGTAAPSAAQHRAAAVESGRRRGSAHRRRRPRALISAWPRSGRGGMAGAAPPPPRVKPSAVCSGRRRTRTHSRPRPPTKATFCAAAFVSAQHGDAELDASRAARSP